MEGAAAIAIAPQVEAVPARPLHLVEERADTPVPPARDTPVPPVRAQGLAETLPMEQLWPLLVDAVRAAKKFGAAAVLERGVPRQLVPDVVVGFAKKGDGAALEDKDTKAAIEAAFERVLGRKAQLKLVEVQGEPQPAVTAPVMASVAEQRERARIAASEQRKQQGREHPGVKAALEVLGGEIEDVKDLGEE
jgi:hypothetical protein